MAKRPYVKGFCVDHARFVYKPNFTGDPSPSSPRGGKREFNIAIDDEGLLERLRSEKWNVKETKTTEEFPEPDFYVPVLIDFHPPKEFLMPHIYLVEGDKTLAELFEEDMEKFSGYIIRDLFIEVRARTWQDDDGTWKVKAYLAELNAEIEENRYAKKFNRSEFQRRNMD